MPVFPHFTRCGGHLKWTGRCFFHCTWKRYATEGKFPDKPAGSNLISAFMGSTVDTLLPNTSSTVEHNETTNTSGTQLKRDSMELMGDTQYEQAATPSSFMESELEEGNLFPWTVEGGLNENTNSYGRPTARIPPTPRADSNNRGSLPRPIPTPLLNHRAASTNFQYLQTGQSKELEVRGNRARPQETTSGIVPVFSLSPILFPLTMGDWLHPVQLVFPFNTTHITKFLLIPAHERQKIRLLLLLVAGHCDLCGKCYKQIALETLREYLVATEYEGETVKVKAIRSRAFIHGFEAALFLFKKAGLSHP